MLTEKFASLPLGFVALVTLVTCASSLVITPSLLDAYKSTSAVLAVDSFASNLGLESCIVRVDVSVHGKSIQQRTYHNCTLSNQQLEFSSPVLGFALNGTIGTATAQVQINGQPWGLDVATLEFYDSSQL